MEGNLEGDGYIPPHARRPDKLPVFLLDESDKTIPAMNVTVRRSNIADTLKLDKSPESAVNAEHDMEPPHPAIMAMFASLGDKMNEQIGRLKRIDLSAVNTNKALQFTQDSVSDLKKRVQTLEGENKALMKLNENYQAQTRDMGRRLDTIEQRLEQNDHTQRRKNILTEGVRESQGENVFDIAMDILSTILPQIGPGNIDFVQRINKPGGKKPILVVFKSILLRDQTLASKKKLNEKPNMKSIWINEDANPTIKAGKGGRE